MSRRSASREAAFGRRPCYILFDGARTRVPRSPHRALLRNRALSSLSYKGFAITPRTFQIRGSGRWTLDLLIGRHKSLRAFSGSTTYATEEAAVKGCHAFAQRIIDGSVPNYSVDDLL